MFSAPALPLVKPSVPPPCPCYGLAGSCRSAMEVGGDLLDVIPLGHDCTIMVMADVMGKGLPASLFAASLRTLLRALAQGTCRPAELLTELNHLMFEQLSSEDTFITVQLVLADLLSHQLRIANAGHCPLLISDGTHSTQAIAPEGMPLGIKTPIIFNEERVQLPPFSSVLLYTDGVTEARSRSGGLFGQARLENWFQQAVASGGNCVGLKQRLLKELSEFQGTDSPLDDQTFLILSDETPRPASMRGEHRYLPLYDVPGGVLRRVKVDALSEECDKAYGNGRHRVA